MQRNFGISLLSDKRLKNNVILRCQVEINNNDFIIIVFETLPGMFVFPHTIQNIDCF